MNQMKVRLSDRAFYDSLGYEPKKMPIKDTIVLERKRSKSDENEYDYSFVIGEEIVEALSLDHEVNIAISSEGIYLSASPLAGGVLCYLSNYGKHKKIRFDELIELLINVFDFVLEYGFVQCDKVTMVDENIVFIQMEEKRL